MNLLETDFYVTKPVLAIHVPFGKGESVHNNRPSHGFAYFANGVYGYTFENKKTIVCKKGDLIYMPQDSNYTVTLQSHTEGAAKNIFAINFLISTDEKFEPFKITLKNPAKIEALFESAEREWVKKDVGYADAGACRKSRHALGRECRSLENQRFSDCTLSPPIPPQYP